MKFLLCLFCGVILTGCESGYALRSNAKKAYARVTFYNPHEDRFGSRVACGGRAHEGETMAAPAVFAFDTRVNVPALCGHVGNGNFVIQDRGTALERAYRRGQLRLDVYVASRAKMARLCHDMPEYMEVEMQ